MDKEEKTQQSTGGGRSDTEEKKFNMNKQQSIGVGGNHATTFFNQPLSTSIRRWTRKRRHNNQLVEDATNPNFLRKLLEGFAVSTITLLN
jgi:hypothetical protein